MGDTATRDDAQHALEATARRLLRRSLQLDDAQASRSLPRRDDDAIDESADQIATLVEQHHRPVVRSHANRRRGKAA